MPLPEVVRHDASSLTLTMREVEGANGQDLIDAGNAREVLQLLGSMLVCLHGIDPLAVAGLPGQGEVIVHGDYGPQNILICGHRITAVLDWEFAHVGSEIEDLAWTEWIVRMHHPHAQDALPDLFRAAKLHPAWSDRRAAMLERCASLLRRAEEGESPDHIGLWRERVIRTENWGE